MVKTNTNASLFEPDQQHRQTKSNSLLKVFEDIHNHIYANDGLSAEQALDETIKLLFLKIYDEKKGSFEFNIQPDEYKQAISTGNAKPFSDRLNVLLKQAIVFFKDILEPDEKFRLKVTSLAYVVNKLQYIDLLGSSNDAKGLAFQKFLSSSQRAGRGQFFTPEQVVRLCVEILQPTSKDKILDPACGSGGFLSASLNYVATSNVNINRLAKDNLYGIEVGHMVAKIAKMRMILAGDGLSSIVRANSLADMNDLDIEINKVSGRAARTYEGFFDAVITNPPFGTQGKISNKSVLGQYELGYRWTINPVTKEYEKTDDLLVGQVPEILFIERCLKFLKPGGKMAIILPSGELENPSLRYVRQYITNVAEIFAVVRLPQETFIPAGTGVKTSILFLRKKQSTKRFANKIYFSQVTKLGYLGNKTGSTVLLKDQHGQVVLDDKGQPLIDEDITDVVKNYFNPASSKSVQNSNYFWLSYKDLSSSRFDFEFYKPQYRQLANKLQAGKAVRLGDIANIKKERSLKLKQKDLVVGYVELSDVSAAYSEITGYNNMMVHELPSRATYELSNGDILLPVAGNALGTPKQASAYVGQEHSGCICSNGFRVITPKKGRIDPYFLLYYFRSPYFLEQVYRLRTGAAIPSIQDEDLRNVLVMLPPANEQQRIGKAISTGIKQRERLKQELQSIKL